MSAPIIAGVGPTPVIEPSEHVLDLVTMAVEQCVARMGTVRLPFDGMRAAMPRAVRAARIQSAL